MFPATRKISSSGTLLPTLSSTKRTWKRRKEGLDPCLDHHLLRCLFSIVLRCSHMSLLISRAHSAEDSILPCPIATLLPHVLLLPPIIVLLLIDILHPVLKNTIKHLFYNHLWRLLIAQFFKDFLVVDLDTGWLSSLSSANDDQRVGWQQDGEIS